MSGIEDGQEFAASDGFLLIQMTGALVRLDRLLIVYADSALTLLLMGKNSP